jgi:hypothetical protein
MRAAGELRHQALCLREPRTNRGLSLRRKAHGEEFANQRSPVNRGAFGECPCIGQ